MNIGKTFKIFTLSLLVAVAVVPSASASPSQSATSVVEEATSAATNYLKSYISNDIDGMLQNSVEPIYPNDQERRAVYEERVKTDVPVIDFKIVESTQVSDSEIDISVEYTTVDTVLPPIPYDVKKIDGDWKVVLVPQEINVNRDSADYGKVQPVDVENVSYISKSGEVVPFVTTLDYYTFYNWAGNTLIGKDTFNTHNNWVSIKGTQYDYTSSGPGSNLSVKYEIITEIGGSIQWYGQKTVQGNYNTSWYYEVINLANSSITNAKLRISSTNARQADGAGNVYEN
ncbi:hypothetical protein [Paenibacillus sp.]|uniref:hypothetical protein n=1 Tax=Paenibacillus sp. TaxID=58172 RepID=UPI00283AAA23|nr:hypothetical protein [Paenibacillus sp.]